MLEFVHKDEIGLNARIKLYVAYDSVTSAKSR